MTTLVIGFLLMFQQIYSPADFTQVPGTSLQARYDAALAQGRRGSDDSFWIAYRFPVRPGVRISTWDGNINISSTTSSDGIEWLPDDPAAQRVGIFLLAGKTDGVIQKTRLINLSQNFRVHDRKVYWLGEPSAEDSLSVLAKLMVESPTKLSSSFANFMTLHDSSNVAERLLKIARTESNPADVRKNAIFWLGQEVSRQAGEELQQLVSDPDTDIQRQAVMAIENAATMTKPYLP